MKEEKTILPINDYDFESAPTIIYDKESLTVKAEKSSGKKSFILKPAPTKKQPDEQKILNEASIYKKMKDIKKQTLPGPQKRFLELGKIGEGASAKVLAFHDINTNRDVAVKILKSDKEEIDILSFTSEAHIVIYFFQH